MEISHPSRRQDLFIGSLATTLIICLGVWLSGPPAADAQTVPARRTVTRLVPLPPFTDDETPPPPAGDPAKAAKEPEPSVPQIPDAPQPQRPDAIIIPVEPPAPDNPADSRRIPGNWMPDGPSTKVFDPSMLDQQPSARFQARPLYPDQMKRDGVSGEALVDFLVDTNGDVRNATAIRATNSQFGEAAVAAVGKWKFKPGRKDRHPVFTHMQVPIEFTLDTSRP